MDSLSEEWISQPRSSSPALHKSSPTSSSGNSQSRIPRLKSRSVSTSSLHTSGSVVAIRNEEGALRERTASDLNVSLGRPHKTPSKVGNRHISTSSLPLTPRGTVQQRIAPTNGEKQQAMPDWRRRVLEDSSKYGGQQDLFSPIGLEHMFKQPSTPKFPWKQKDQKFEATEVDHFPSSPALNAEPIRKTSRARKLPVRKVTENYTRDDIKKVPPSARNSRNADHSLGNRNSTTSQRSSAIEDLSTDSQREPAVISPLRAYQVNSAEHIHQPPPGESLKDQSRITSTHSELRHEIISPVSLPRHAFSQQSSKSSVNLSSSRSKSELGKTTDGPYTRPSSRSSDHGIYGRMQPTSVKEDQMKDLTSHSLPDDLSVGTEIFVANGGFVNTRRGGYSADGSFRRKPLSPSSLPHSDVVFEDSCMAVSSRKPQERCSSISNFGIQGQQITPSSDAEDAPRTPVRTQQQGQGSPDKTRSSGSPLKLFDTYDTYTNDRLLRRMSQFEESYQGNSSNLESDCENIESQSGVHQPQSLPSLPSALPQKRSSRRISSFGEGKLDSFGFTHRASLQTGNAPDDNKIPSPLCQHDNDDQISFGTRLAVSPTSSTRRKLETSQGYRPKLHSSRKSSRGSQSTTELRLESAGIVAGAIHKLEEPSGIEKSGKRFLNSPVKDSQAKRRRTIYVEEDKPLNVDDHLLVEAVLPIPSVSIIGKKRKDARYEHGSQTADPKILAKRSILRPRTPTPNQIRSGNGYIAPSTSNQSKTVQIPDMSGVVEKMTAKDLPAQTVDQSTHILAEELATFALDVAQDIATGARKTSVTTADFFNEANLIMQHIRAKEQSQSTRENGDNSDFEQLENIEESIHEGSTKEQLSRPPSREGGSLRKLREPKQLDPRVVSHLRKYEDKSDIDVGLSTSTKSLNIVVEGLGQVREPVDSEPPNIRIRNSQQPIGSWKLDARTYSSHDQHSTSTSSKGSIPSGSSNSSGNKVTIAPQKISHLISDHVAGMTFDRTRQAWVKRRVSNAKGSDPDDRLSEFTEEDPLREIPDLSVDELEELNQIKAHLDSSLPPSDDLAEGSRQSMSPESKQYDNNNSSLQRFEAKIRQHHKKPEPLERPESNLDGLHVRNLSNPQNEQGSRLLATQSKTDQASSTKRVDLEEDVEHEISILEGRSERPLIQSKDRSRQPRVVTVAFSSPLIDGIYEKNSFTEPIEDWELDDELNKKFTQDHSYIRQASNATLAQKTPGYKQTSSFRRGGRRTSVITRSYLTQPVSRIDEQDELMFLDDHRVCNTVGRDIVLTTPQQPLSTSQRHVSISPGEASDPSFHLTPLPNFSIHQIDEVVDLNTKKRGGRRSRLSAEVARRPFDLSVKEIVKKITDIEPYEPYWEHIRKLNLQNKELLTLHELKEFCDRIEELNISENELGHLDGAPSGIRVLNARGNCLSSLTDWSHLQNLQYLDISDNQVQDLYGFRGLWHLRDIRADNNQIEDLSGIDSLDGLLRLSLKQNHVAALNFKGTNL